jgi:hypothetical protein
MASLSLGTEHRDSKVLHVKRGALKMTALCGLHPVGAMPTFGVGKKVCTECLDEVKRLDERGLVDAAHIYRAVASGGTTDE